MDVLRRPDRREVSHPEVLREPPGDGEQTRRRPREVLRADPLLRLQQRHQARVKSAGLTCTNSAYEGSPQISGFGPENSDLSWSKIVPSP